ncbi:hypothetical protein FLK61_37305 [Paenalkalicoccus suaedae]|uniref:Uncharacterized protein n=1 Tax=Paenalkalicoccus suaedae TaxID=2592382 RepID=A0A859FIZ8_9BACI|nr:hypothetical protein [Paenalkalicoccus suaedae]QKS72295.1 hypothetical protein FLK61_37305 [Paenalkalicoccus suaedae]
MGRDIELLKVVMHRLAKIESQLITKNDMDTIHEQLDEQLSNLQLIEHRVQELSHVSERQYKEHVNSDEALVRMLVKIYQDEQQTQVGS